MKRVILVIKNVPARPGMQHVNIYKLKKNTIYIWLKTHITIIKSHAKVKQYQRRLQNQIKENDGRQSFTKFITFSLSLIYQHGFK